MPPEAYTNKELAQAMQWRESQPEYVKAMTNTPESLISMFKKAQRNPGSEKMSENFRSDLKDLASNLKDFEGQLTSKSIPGSFQEVADMAAPKSPAINKAQKPSNASTQPSFDPQTQAMIQEIRNGLNLSNEGEALRMLVKLGFERARTLLS